jgi:hypothetical protein
MMLNKLGPAMIAIGIIGFLVQVALIGVGVWAVIKVVAHFIG